MHIAVIFEQGSVADGKQFKQDYIAQTRVKSSPQKNTLLPSRDRYEISISQVIMNIFCLYFIFLLSPTRLWHYLTNGVTRRLLVRIVSRSRALGSPLFAHHFSFLCSICFIILLSSFYVFCSMLKMSPDYLFLIVPSISLVSFIHSVERKCKVVLETIRYVL